MLKIVPLPIDAVYVPVKRAKTLDAAKVEALANDMLENGQTTPIRVRADGKRYVLIEGYHRLEALRALGEDRVDGFVVQARQH
ncbi:MAG: putative transcriptional regulator [Halomonas sp. HL-93]|nr:MAG: putative transcriptional regulator [Halomonas sp. HL-93]